MPSELVWVITGTSSGIGKQLVFEALSRGDKVIATARAHSLKNISELHRAGAQVLELDVTAPPEQLKKTALEAEAIYGRVDVVVNNAGYVLCGALEEYEPQETLDLFNTHVFGGLNVARAFLPSMRAQKSGTIAWIGSILGHYGDVGTGAYCAAKYAMRGMSQSLHRELQTISPNLRSVIFEPGAVRTPVLLSSRLVLGKRRIDDYSTVTKQYKNLHHSVRGTQIGDPDKLCKIIVDIVRGEGVAVGRPFPLALQLVSDCVDLVEQGYKDSLAHIEEWGDVGRSVDYASKQ